MRLVFPGRGASPVALAPLGLPRRACFGSDLVVSGLGLDPIRRFGWGPAGPASFRACISRSRCLPAVLSVEVRLTLVDVGVEQTLMLARWPALRRKGVEAETNKNSSDEYWTAYDLAVFRV